MKKVYALALLFFSSLALANDAQPVGSGIEVTQQTAAPGVTGTNRYWVKVPTDHPFFTDTSNVDHDLLAGSGITYGGFVIGGHPNEILYINGAGNLASDSTLTRVATTSFTAQAASGGITVTSFVQTAGSVIAGAVGTNATETSFVTAGQVNASLGVQELYQETVNNTHAITQAHGNGGFAAFDIVVGPTGGGGGVVQTMQQNVWQVVNGATSSPIFGTNPSANNFFVDATNFVIRGRSYQFPTVYGAAGSVLTDTTGGGVLAWNPASSISPWQQPGGIGTPVDLVDNTAQVVVLNPNVGQNGNIQVANPNGVANGVGITFVTDATTTGSSPVSNNGTGGIWQIGAELNGLVYQKFSLYNVGNGADIMTLDGAAQTVGINNSSPLYAMDVVGDVYASGSFRGNPVVLEPTVDSTSSIELRDSTGSFTYFYVDTTNGNVVVGSPSARFISDASANYITSPTMQINGVNYSWTGSAAVGQSWLLNDGAGNLSWGTNTLYTAQNNKVVNVGGADTSIIGTGSGSLTIPANFFNTAKTLHIRAAGVLTVDAADTPNSFLFKIWKNGIGGTLIASSNQPNIVTVSGLIWTLNFDITGQSATTVVGNSEVTYALTPTATNASIGTGATPVTISAAAEALDVSVQIKNDLASNSSVTCTNFTLSY